MAELTGLILGVAGAADQLVDLGKRIIDRCKAFRRNEGAAACLLKAYTLIVSQIGTLLESDGDTLNDLAPSRRYILEQDLNSLLDFAKKAKVKLNQLLDEKLRSTYYAITHAKRIASRLSELQGEAEKAQERIRSNNVFLAILERIHRAAVDPSTGCPDKFQPCNTAPRNSGQIFVDLDSTDSNGVPATFAGQLKAALLQSTTASSFGAIARGMGGVGKTCSLRALAADDDIKARFPGGVYFMSLGADATTMEVIHELAGSIEASGGRRIATAVRQDSSMCGLRGAIRKAKSWFSGRSCLFIFDDIWRSNDIQSDVLSKLSVLVSDYSNESASRLLYSTRDEWLSLQGETVVFRPREVLGKESVMILLGAAGADREEIDDEVCRPAILGILDKCGGLPVTLNLCGASVRRMRGTYTSDHRDVWDEYWRDLSSKSLISESLDHYGPLNAALLVSLEFLDKREAIDEDRGHLGLSHAQLHRALCILRKRDWIPVGVLRQLWNLTDLSSTTRIISNMAGVGIVYAERRRLHDGQTVLGIRLHDLVHDFALQEAKKYKEESKWPSALVDAFRIRRGKEVLHACALDCENGNDGRYMTRNLCRLLVGASRLDEVEALLHTAGWSVKMLEMGDIVQLEQDVELFMQSCRADNEPGSKNEGLGISMPIRESERWLRALYKIVRQSLPYCTGNAHVAWFQLYARLMGTTKKPKWMQEMMNEAHVHAPRPWIRALAPCLKGANDALVDTYFAKYPVHSVECVNGEAVSLEWPYGTGVVLVGKHESYGDNNVTQLSSNSIPFVTDSDGLENYSQESTTPNATVQCGAIFKDGMRVVTGWRAGTVRVNDVKSGEVLWQKTDCHTSVVTSVAVSHDGSRIVSGSRDCSVRVWNWTNGKLVGPKPLTGHTDWVWSVALSGDGRRVVSGSIDRTVRVWDPELGKQFGPALPGQTGGLLCVTVSEDGRWVASGSDDGSVRVWDMDCRQQVRSAFSGHAGRVLCVAVSRDGRRVVSGSIDRTVRVWDTESRQQIGPALTGHTEWVQSVALSREGRWVVSGSVDRTVLMWDTESSEAGLALPRDTTRVQSVAVSTDGWRAVSGADDGTLRVWDTESGQQVGPTLIGHTDSVLSVAVSKDGRRVVSASNDRTMRVWSTESGKQVGPTHTGHSGWVWSLAMSGDGRMVVSAANDRTVRVWHAETGKLIVPALTGHTKRVLSVAVSGDGLRLVSGSDDETVRVWDMRTGTQIGAPLHGQSGPVRRVAISANGQRVVSGSYDGTVQVWDVKTSARLQFKDVNLRTGWAELCGRYLEQYEPNPLRNSIAKYFARDRNIIYRAGESEKIVATLEAEIYTFEVTETRTAVAALTKGAMAFLKIVE